MECRHIYGITYNLKNLELNVVEIIFPDSIEEVKDELKKIKFRFNYCPLCGIELDWSWAIEEKV
jgi:hypothetical protein